MHFINFKKKQIFLIISTIIFFTLVMNSVFAASDSIDVNQQVIKGIPCNYNGICEPEWGEDPDFCSDCVTAFHSSQPAASEAFPESPELIINNNNAYTNSLDVVLYFSVKDAFQVMVNNKDNFYGIFWEPFQFTKEWKLAPGEDGERTVYAKFKSVSGGFAEIVSDSIILDRTAPANVTDLQADMDKKQIELKWQNPTDQDLKSVRILRSEFFFPINPQDKGMIFDGRKEFFIDKDVEEGKNYYYTAFSYDYAGNFSSGALISAGLKIKEEIAKEPSEIEKIPFKKMPPFEKLPETPEEEIPLSVKNLTLKDFDFFQNGKKINILDDEIINVNSEVSFTISIDYEKLPEVLKTIIITLEKPSEENSAVKLRKYAYAKGKYFSFLLRINSDKTAYQAIIQPPEIGHYPLTIGILDVKNQVSKKIYGILKVEERKQISIPSFLLHFPFTSFVFLILILIVIISLIWIIVAWIMKKIKILRERFSEN